MTKIIAHTQPWPTTKRPRTIQAALTMRKALRKKAECIKQAMIRAMVLMPCNCTYQSWIPTAQPFYQYPKRKWSPECLIWYENRPLCVNKLGDMMKDISAEAELSQKHTNHCVRATAITLWSNAGLANRHIMAISGHRNEQLLRSYNACGVGQGLLS